MAANEMPTKNELNTMWIDHEPDVFGILLSDRIAFYACKVGLIEPFLKEHLAPASYDLTLGSECWDSEHAKETGQARRILKKGEPLIIAPNSIVFVSTAETLNLPFYLVGRFNLKLRLLHEGLLVGVGPQIDPGYAGRLSCPLHNISSEKISIVCGETFAVIEFQKTTPFAQEEKWSTETDISEIRNRGERSDLKGLDGFPCLTFPAKSLGREPVKGYLPPGKAISSSLLGLSSELKELDSSITTRVEELSSRVHAVQVVGFVAVVVVAISLGTYFWAAINFYRAQTDAATQAATQAVQQVKVSDVQRAALEQKVKDLEQRLDKAKIPK